MKIFLLIMLASAIFMVTGCGAGASNNSTSETPGTLQSGVPTEPSSEDTAEEAAKNTVLWINGTHAVLTKTNKLDWRYFGGAEYSPQYNDPMKKMLDDYWGITSKETLLEAVTNLTTGNGHNASLIEDINGLALDKGMTLEEFDKWLEDQADFDDIAINYLSAGYEAYTKYGDNAISGWDLSRATQLLGQGYLAGYIEHEEALNLALDIAKQIQSTFDSWDSFWDSYMLGYVYWSEDMRTDQTSGYAARVKILEDLKADKKSPLYIDWGTELVKSW